MALRVDYFQIGLNSKNCLQLLRTLKDEVDDSIQLIAGDHSGYIQSSRIRSGRQVDDVFKSNPTPNMKVSSMDVSEGKAFFSPSSVTIKGITRKGKQFFNLELNDLTEPIAHLKVNWPKEIYVCGNYMYNHYVLYSEGNIQMSDSYVSPGKVTAMCIVKQKSNEPNIPVLASEDRLLQILSGSKCDFELETNGIATCLLAMNPNQTGHSAFLYGSTDGKVTMVDLDSISPSFKWEVPESISGLHSSNKSCVEVIELSPTGPEMFIGRSDGTVEVWTFGGSLTVDGTEAVDYGSAPVLRFTYNCNESITSLVPSIDNVFLVVCTFSGCVFGLSWRGQNALAGVQSHRKRIQEVQKKIELLRSECASLEAQLAIERNKYLESNKNEKKQSSIPLFAIKDSLILTDDACYLLTIEAEVAIDVVILQSDVPVMLVDSEKNSAVVSVTETDTQQVLATFRCQSNTTRLEVTVKTIEGQYGHMRGYCISRLSPKTCHVKMYYLSPLSLHKRSYAASVNKDISLNTLVIDGNFSHEQAYQWVHLCLPEVPSQMPPNLSGSSISFHFKSTLYPTFVSCNIRKGKLLFESDSVSSISILKDFITRDATTKSIPVHVESTLSVQSVSRVLKLLYPVARRLTQLRKLEQLKEAINELSRNESDIVTSFTSEIEAEFNQVTHELDLECKMNAAASSDCNSIPSTLDIDRVNGLVTDLFIDYTKLRGLVMKDARGKSSQLPSVLEKSVAKGNVDEFVSDLFHHWGVNSSTGK